MQGVRKAALDQLIAPDLNLNQMTGAGLEQFSGAITPSPEPLAPETPLTLVLRMDDGSPGLASVWFCLYASGLRYSEGLSRPPILDLEGMTSLSQPARSEGFTFSRKKAPVL